MGPLFRGQRVVVVGIKVAHSPAGHRHRSTGCCISSGLQRVVVVGFAWRKVGIHGCYSARKRRIAHRYRGGFGVEIDQTFFRIAPNIERGLWTKQVAILYISRYIFKHMKVIPKELMVNFMFTPSNSCVFNPKLIHNT